MFRIIGPLSFVGLFAIPYAAFAQTTVQDILTAFTTSFSAFVPVTLGLALVTFIWGMIRFIFASGNEKEIESGRHRMVWGVVALFFIISIWGIVLLLMNMSGASQGSTPGNKCPAPSLDLEEGSATTCF